MRSNCVKIIVAGMLILIFMVGCGPDGNAINEGANGAVSENADDSGYHAGEQEKQNDTKPEQPEENKNSQPQPQTTASAENLEKEMAAYRAEREKGVSSLGNYTMVQLPNGENYKYGVGDIGNTPEFDSRELNLAYKVADDYVEEILKMESEVWECIDPRMIAIYEDKDKGVANGYDADNIFLCEYNDNGKWQYLILVREKKGSEWKVLYHGDSYKTDESDGGEKNEKTNMDGIPEVVE